MLHQVLQQLQSQLTTDEGRLLLKQALELEHSPEPKQQAELYFFLFRSIRKLCDIPDPNPKAKKHDTPSSIEQLSKQLYHHLSRFRQGLRVSHCVSFFNHFDLLVLGQNKGVNQIIVDWNTWIKWTKFWGSLLLDVSKHIENLHKNKKWLFELHPKNEGMMKLFDNRGAIYSQFDHWRQDFLNKHRDQHFFYSINEWGLQHADMLLQKKNVFYISVQRGMPFQAFRQWIGSVLRFYIDLIGNLYENEDFFISSLQEMALDLCDLMRLAQEAEQSHQFIEFLDILQLSLAEEQTSMRLHQDKLLSDKSRAFHLKSTLSKLWHFINTHSYLQKERPLIWIENAQWLDQESFESLVKFIEHQSQTQNNHLSILFNHTQPHDLLNLLSNIQASKIEGMVELKTQVHLDELLGDSAYPLELTDLLKPIKYKTTPSKTGLLWQEEMWDFLMLLVMEDKLKWLQAEQRWVYTETLQHVDDYVKQSWRDAVTGLFEEDKLWLKKLYLCKDMSSVLLLQLIPVSSVARFIEAGWVTENLKISNQALLQCIADLFDADEQKQMLKELISLIEKRFKESLMIQDIAENANSNAGQDQSKRLFEFDLGALENHIKDIEKFVVHRDFYALLPFYAKWNYQLRQLDKNFVAYCLLLKNAMSLGLYYYAKNLWELSQVSVAQMSESEIDPYLFIKSAIEQQYLLFQNQSHLLLDQLPSNANARLEMAQIHLLQGQLEEAKELLIPLFPFKRELKFWGRARFLFALYLHQNKEFEESNLLLDEILSSAIFDDFKLEQEKIFHILSISSTSKSLAKNYQQLKEHFLLKIKELCENLPEIELGFKEIKQELSFRLQVLQLQFKNILALIHIRKTNATQLKYRALLYFAEMVFTQYDYREKEGFAYSLNHFSDLLLIDDEWETAIQFKEYSKSIFQELTPYFHHKNDEVIWEIEMGICDILLQVYRYEDVKKRLQIFTKENPLFSSSNTTQSLTPQINALSAKIYYLLGLCEFHLKEYPQATQILSQATQIFKSIPYQETYTKTLAFLAHTLIETTYIFKKTNQSNMLDKISHLLDGANSYAILVQKHEKNLSHLFYHRLLIQLRVLGLKNELKNMEQVYFKVNEFRQLIKADLLKYEKLSLQEKIYLTLIELEIYYLMDTKSDEINQIKLDLKEDKHFTLFHERIRSCLKALQLSFKTLRIDQEKFSFWEMNMIKKRIQALQLWDMN